MRQILLSIMLVMTAVAAFDGELKPYSGAPLPDFTLMDLQGRQQQLSSLRGKVVLVNFWATYCTPCVKEMPSMQRLADKFAGKPFQILAIDMAEERAGVDTFLKRFKLNLGFPILFDSEGQVAEAWRVNVLPISFIVDPHGQIRYVIHGAIEWDGDKAVGIVAGLMKR